MFKNFFKEFKKSKNKIYVILKYNTSISGFFAVVTIVSGTIGFIINEEPYSTSFLNSIKMFGLDFPSHTNETNFFIYIAIGSAIITISLVALLFFVKESLNTFLIRRIFKKDHIAVFGLGEASVSFLNSYSLIKGKEDIAIIEADPNNTKLEEFRKNGVGVFIGDSLSDKSLKLLNFQKMKYAIIAMGSDKINIELAKKIINLYEAKHIKTPIKLIIHIQNRDLDILFHQKFIVPDQTKDQKIEIKTFSFFNEAAEELFEKHAVDGKSRKYINSKEAFNTILIGNGELIKSVIYQMALLSHLPNENVHTVYIVDKHATKLLHKIKKHLYYRTEPEDNFPSFKIEAVDIDRDSLAYYDNPIWLMENLVNVIIANDAENENLDLAIELFNRVYLSKAKEDKDMPEIIFAMYDPLILNKIINKDKDSFKHFHTFGNSENVLSYSNLIEEEKYALARLINLGYGDKYNPEVSAFDKEKANAKWYNRDKYSNKLSSISQAKHIDMKLKAMGLKKEKLDQPPISTEELVKQNKLELSRIFDDERNKLKIGDEELKEYSEELSKLYACENNNYSFNIMYFPKAYDTLFEKMIRMEHNRWNAYHYLNGWKFKDLVCPIKYDDSCKEREWIENKKDNRKDKKKHDCLLPLKDFKEPRNQITVIYDIYSFLYLPNYLAELGYKIVRI